jgi:hypothetical protein
VSVGRNARDRGRRLRLSLLESPASSFVDVPKPDQAFDLVCAVALQHPPDLHADRCHLRQ